MAEEVPVEVPVEETPAPVAEEPKAEEAAAPAAEEAAAPTVEEAAAPAAEEAAAPAAEEPAAPAAEEPAAPTAEESAPAAEEPAPVAAAEPTDAPAPVVGEPAAPAPAETPAAAASGTESATTEAEKVAEEEPAAPVAVAGEHKEEPVKAAPAPAAAPEKPAAKPEKPAPAPVQPFAVESNNNSVTVKSNSSTRKHNDSKHLKAGTVERQVKNMAEQMSVEISDSRKIKKGVPALGAMSQYSIGPKFTMGGSRENVRFGAMDFVSSGKSPAPGTYNVANSVIGKYKSVNKVSFGVGQRFRGPSLRSQTENPAPGQYGNPVDPMLKAPTAVSMGKSSRDPQKVATKGNTAPGPGAYEFRSTVGAGPRFTARGRDAFKEKKTTDDKPGPGSYNVKRGFSSFKVGFGTSTRDGEARRMLGDTAGPGPGSYDPTGRGPVPKISFTGRPSEMNLISSYLTPGPGSYDTNASTFATYGADRPNPHKMIKSISQPSVSLSQPSISLQQ